jgi:hypothetical protein
MKAEEVITLLQASLPTINNSFSDNFVISSIENNTGTTVTVITLDDNGFSLGQMVLISGVNSNVVIDSLTRLQDVGTLITNTDHDVTNGLKIIEISGSIEPEFNGTFTIINVQNRRTITFQMINSGPTVSTGFPILVNGESIFRGYNGIQTISNIVNTTTFEYEITQTGLQPGTGSDMLAIQGVRIVGGATVERCVEAYTKQETLQNWLFVVLGDVTASKSRHISEDGVSNQQRGQQNIGFYQQIIQTLSIYVFLPTADQLSGRAARDESEEIFRDICRSILFYKFDSNLYDKSKGSLAVENHGLYAYNSAYYVHQYNFEQTVDLTYEDTVGANVDVAFRDIELILNQTTGNEPFTAKINLDEIPL